MKCGLTSLQQQKTVFFFLEQFTTRMDIENIKRRKGDKGIGRKRKITEEIIQKILNLSRFKERMRSER